MLTATVPAKGQLTTIALSKVDALPLKVLFLLDLASVYEEVSNSVYSAGLIRR